MKTTDKTEKRGPGRPPVSLEDKLLAAVYPNGKQIPITEFQAVTAWLNEARRLAVTA